MFEYLQYRLPKLPGQRVTLRNLETDLSEEVNLKDEFPQIVQELSQAALAWRKGIEQRWEQEFFVSEEDITIVTY